MARQQVAEQKAGQDAPHASAAPDPEWKPSRFFDAWKKSLVTMEDSLVLQYLHYCRGMPPDVKKRAVDHILRGTMPDVYQSADRDEAFDAMDNDIDAMRVYAALFLDKFWKERWADFLAKCPHIRRDPGPADTACAQRQDDGGSLRPVRASGAALAVGNSGASTTYETARSGCLAAEHGKS